jgi:alkylation response protein AidB-like acyl-CoA dehydrogenase
MIATEMNTTNAAAPADSAATDATERAEQINQLRESAIAFTSGTKDHKRLRAQRSVLPGYDAKIARQMAELGWFSILVPEAHGGLGLGLAEMSVVLQELGKGLLAEPLIATVVLAGQTLRYGDNADLQHRLLTQLAEGRLIPCVAWQDDVGGLEMMPTQTVVQTVDGKSLITGRKRFVAGAGAADGFLVTARDQDHAGIYWILADAPGLEVTHEWRADGTPSVTLTLTNVAVTADNVLSPPSSHALTGLKRAVEQACVMASAEMLGVIEATMTMTLDYMRNRVQFGKAIGSFQALQHRASDLYIQQELTRAVLGDAVQSLDSGADALECSKIASRCKSRASEAGLRVTREAIQLHGAIGFTDEYDLGLYVKRALVLSAWLGNATAHRRRFAELNAPLWQG